MPRRLRIFISSPADVPDERLRVALIIDRLSQDYSRFFTIETYRWEHEPMLAAGHFQDAIEPPSAFDIVILILWSRLGTPLPERTAEREYRGIDGRAPVTGTEWEYEEALKVARETKNPDILAFRNISPAPIDPRDPEAQAKSMAQLNALNAFWTQHFVDRGVFLAAFDEYRTLEEFARRLEQSLRKLIERRIKDASAGKPQTEQIWLGDPFRGLESYEFKHAPIFFGRDAAVTKATEQLAANARSGRAFLLVSGASGSGKSSLVKAAIVPRLMKPQRISGAAFLRRAVFSPGSEGGDVFLGLAKTLIRGDAPDVGLSELVAKGQDAAQLAAHLRGAAGEPGYLFVNALSRLTEGARQAGRLLAFEEARLILVVDQLEELFTEPAISAEDRKLFIQLLGGLARCGAVWVIGTLRADFWHRAAEISELAMLAAGEGRVDLAAPSPAELAEMIRKPAQAAGLSFEAQAQSGIGLDAVLAEDAAAAPGALPLLSFTLDELYKDAKARGEAVLTHASYEALGGLEGAIARRADAVVAGLPAAAQAALPRVLRALTTVTTATDRAPVARAVPIEMFPQGNPARTLIDSFIAARLLVAAGENGAPATVRLAHEALISRWQRAQDQLATDHRDLETRALVEQQFGRWSAKQRSALLLRNPDLANAVDLARRWGDELDPSLQYFIHRSARRARLTQTLTAAAAVLFALIAVAAGGLYFAAEKQRNDALIAQSNYLAHDARAATANGDPTLGALLALAALPANLAAPDRPFVKEAGFALEDALAQEHERAFIASNRSIQAVAMSPDGSKVATGTDDKLVRIWDGRTGKQLLELAHDSTVKQVSFSSDGKQLTTNADTRRVWDTDSGREVFALPAQEAGAGSEHDLALSSDNKSGDVSRDGTRRLTRSRDDRLGFQETPRGGIVTRSGEVHLWDTVRGSEIISIQSMNPRLSGVFSPDGGRVLVSFDAIGSTTTRLLDSANGVEIGRLEGQLQPSGGSAFTPDGRLVVTAAANGAAKVWDVKTGSLVMTLRDAAIYSLQSASFSSDGRSLMTASSQSVQVWNLDPSVVALRDGDNDLRGYRSRVSSVVFSPDGTKLATASADKTARVWDVRTGAASLTLRGHHAEVMSVAFAPDGKHLLTASLDKTARLWDATTGAVLRVFEGHGDAVNAASFSPDGKFIVTASADKTAKVWDAASGNVLVTFRGHDNAVLSASFSPDGKNVLSVSKRKLLIWSTQNGAVLKELARLQEGQSSVWSNVTNPKDADAWNRWIIVAEAGAHVKEVDTAGWHRSFAHFSADGSQVVGALNEWLVEVWNVGTGLPVHIFLKNVLSVATWDAQFSPDGRYIASASTDGVTKLWAVQPGEPDIPLVTEVAGDGGAIKAVAFSPSGAQLATAAADGTVRITKIAHCQAAIDRAHELLPRELSDYESHKYFLTKKTASTATDIFAKMRPWLAFASPAAGDACE
jgi:WD40 repeat protein